MSRSEVTGALYQPRLRDFVPIGIARLFLELAISVKLDPLDVEPTQRQTNVAALVGLITIQPATSNPFAVRKLSFLRGQDPYNYITRRRRFERND